MRSIAKPDQEKLSKLTAELKNAAEEVRAMIEAFNEALAEPKEEVEKAVAAYGVARSALTEFLEALASRAEEYIETRSERWRDSEAGLVYDAWWNSFIEAANSIPELDEIQIEDLADPDELFDADSWDCPPNEPEE